MAPMFNKVGNIKGPQPWTSPPVPWAANTAYTANPPASTVTYQGGTYVCSTSHTSTATFNAADFTLIAGQGNTGNAGANGTNGTNGAAGTRGSIITTGSGAPATPAGTIVGDTYIDISSGDLYQAQ